jgi:hypothetical protein
MRTGETSAMLNSTQSVLDVVLYCVKPAFSTNCYPMEYDGMKAGAQVDRSHLPPLNLSSGSGAVSVNKRVRLA